MKARITILCENSVGRLIGSGEHGFCSFIETEQGNILFDTGNGHGVVSNSLALNKDLRSVRKIFLSHGHNDHTGGLPEVLKLTNKVDVHAHPHIFLDRVAIRKAEGGEIRRFAGLVYKKTYLEFLGANFILNQDFTEVGKGLFLTGEVPRHTPFEKNDPSLFVELDGKMIPDVLMDDQSLVLDTGEGLILLLGCAHSGMINIMDHVIKKTSRQKFKAVLGGTHLDFLTPEQLEESIKILKQMEIDQIAVSHCTGMRAASRLQQEFGSRFVYGCVGTVFNF